ncbi:MAG: FtsX-like permease family protein [Acidobacteria bacterium]|nr:FtsX-like permease family protein [Acidobacteriota bacterium]
MNAKVLTKVAIDSIAKNKTRTFLTMLGIVIGVGAVIIMVAIGEGAQAQIQEQINGLGTNMIVITPGSTNSGGVSQGAATANALTVGDVDYLRRESVLLAALSPVISTRTQAVGGSGNWRTSILGVATDYQTIRDWPMTSGVFFDEADVQSMRKVVVLGRTVADSLFSGIDPVGEQVRLGTVPFQVVGVLAPKGQTPEGTDQDDVIVAPYTTVQTRLAGRSWIPQILASTSSPDLIVEAQAEIKLIMRDAHELAGAIPDDFTVRNQNELAAAAQSTTQVMTLLLASIASISLLVGGIGIMNIMLVSVTERTREIGLRLALGARGVDIRRQFLFESIVLSTLGGFIGLTLGTAGAFALARFAGWGVAVSPAMTLVAVGFASAVGMFFGFFPARQASKLNPIDALRYE